MAELKVYLSAQTKRFERGMKKANRATRRLSGQIKRYGAMATGAFAAAGVASVKAFGEQEQAEQNLRSALASNGDAADSLMVKYKAFASQIQQNTTSGDEYVLNLMAQIRNLGVLPDQLEQTTKGAIGLGKALQLDANSAARYAALAMKGEYTILQRYVPALRTATSEEEKHKTVTDLMAKGYKQAMAEADTTAGRLDQVKNAFGDAMEGFGAIIANTLGLEDSAKGTTSKVAKLATTMKEDAGEIAYSFQSVAIDVKAAATQSIRVVENIVKMRYKPLREVGKRFAKAAGLSYLARAAETAKMAKQRFPAQEDREGGLAGWGTIGKRLKFFGGQMWQKVPFAEPEVGGVGFVDSIAQTEAERQRAQQKLLTGYKEGVAEDAAEKRAQRTRERQAEAAEKQADTLDKLWDSLSDTQATFP